MTVEKVPTEKITLDPKLQPRNELNADAILQYSLDMKAGDVFPPVEIKNVNGRYYLTSGWHRTLAAKKAKLNTIDAIVVPGTLDDAIWDACAANIEHDKSGSRRTNRDKQKAVKMALQLGRFHNGQMNYSEIARHVGVSNVMVKNWADRLGLSETKNNSKTFNIVPEITNDPTPQREDNWRERWEKEQKQKFWEDQEIEKIQEEIETEKKATLNKTNENIEWAAWSWNPVTGCLHGCEYCYARDIAERFYPEGFQPAFHPDRLEAPENTNVPMEPRFLGDTGYKNIFTCSMADLFGKWVPVEWIEAVLNQVRNNPQWNFLLLTKFPIRMSEFDYPDNAWLGTSVDAQHAVGRAEKAFQVLRDKGYKGIGWVSCEPMMERITFDKLELFDWLVLGGASKSTKTPEFKPPFEWINHAYNQAKEIGCKVYMKTNLLGERERQYPK